MSESSIGEFPGYASVPPDPSAQVGFWSERWRYWEQEVSVRRELERVERTTRDGLFEDFSYIDNLISAILQLKSACADATILPYQMGVAAGEVFWDVDQLIRAARDRLSLKYITVEDHLRLLIAEIWTLDQWIHLGKDLEVRAMNGEDTRIYVELPI